MDEVKSAFLRRVLGLPRNAEDRFDLMTSTNSHVEEAAQDFHFLAKTVSGISEGNPSEKISYFEMNSCHFPRWHYIDGRNVTSAAGTFSPGCP